MATNAFYCPRCGEFNKHCEISLREFTALNNGSMIEQVVGALGGDVLGGRRLVSLVTGCHFWKCMSCGLATSRNASGDITNTAENS